MLVPLRGAWVGAIIFAMFCAAHAQWTTQTITLKAGWNGVFLHVDPSHATLNALVAGDVNNPIIEVWRWNPPSAAQFVDNPAEPTAGSEFTSWQRSDPGSRLQRLHGDTAYLVNVGTNVESYVWSVKGRPVLPRREWTISGLNLIGFPTVPSAPPLFDTFLNQAPELQSATPEIYYYRGGDLGTKNPSILPSTLFRSPAFGAVTRGQAFWMRSGTVFNRYFGPFEIVPGSTDGGHFGDSRSSSSFRLRNLTTNNLTVFLRLRASEAAPVGEVAIDAAPPLILRGTPNPINLTYGHTNLPVNSARSWTLAPRNKPGSEAEVVLGLNRSAISLPPNSFLAGVLSFTDSLGISHVEMPVSATVASSAGLWVGDASVTHVGHYLVDYARGTVTNYVRSTAEGEVVTTTVTNALLTGTDGRYVVSSVNTNLGSISRPYPLRLIVHNPENGSASLLQRVYLGLGATTNATVANGESAIHPAFLKNARRISATQLPWTPTNTAWGLGGRIGQSPSLTALVSLPYSDHASNPFLHTYHPDHDNLDATFKNVLPQGAESYTIDRSITLHLQPPANDFNSLVGASETVTGQYLETIKLRGLGDSVREYQVSGRFTLNRMSKVPTLTLAP